MFVLWDEMSISISSLLLQIVYSNETPDLKHMAAYTVHPSPHISLCVGLDDPNNVFSCKPDEECCTKNLEPACCASMPTDMMIEDQITLWVTLAGLPQN